MSYPSPSIYNSFKKVFFVICLILSSSLVYGQVSESEEEQYRIKFEEILSSSRPDSVKFQFFVKNLRTLDPLFSALPISYAQKGLKLANETNDPRWKAEMNYNLGILYSTISEKDSATFFVEKALVEFKKTGNEEKILAMHSILSQMHAVNDSSDESLNHSYAAIKIYEKNGDKEGIAKSNLQIAGNLHNFQESTRAIEFAEKALKIYEETGNSYQQFDTYMHLAVYHIESEELALLQLEKGLQILKENPQFDSAAWVHFYCSRIAVFEDLQDHEAIELDLKKVDSLTVDNRNVHMGFYLALKKAVNAYQLGRYDEATKLFKENINDPLAKNNPHLYYNYEYLAKNYEKLNQWDSTYHYHMILHEMDNSDKMRESKMKMEQIKAAYETEKKEAIIINQKRRLTQQRLIQWLALGVVLLLGLLLFQSLKSERLKRKANEELKNLDSVKSRLYNNITHEFRTPLTVISGMATQIEDNPEEWMQDGLTMIQRNSNRLLELVNQMLDLSRLQSGTVNLNYQQDDLILYLSYIVQSMHSFAKSKNIQIHFHSEEQELNMDYDAEKIQQIIVNLLSNAVKFTPHEGNIYVLVRTVSGNSSSERTKALQIIVKDTGEGIPKNQIPYIFDRFYQVDSSSTRGSEGSGVGLAIVKELVNMMNGEIKVKSTYIKEHTTSGTEFTLHLPITTNSSKATTSTLFSKKELVDHSNPTPRSPLAQETKTFTDSSKPSLLLVEDNADVVTYITSCLQDDYEVMVGNNGEEGINLAFENSPDLIITDVMMPIKDGYQVCEELKSDIRTSHIPIIMLTAKADLDSKIDGLEKGADVYLAKPFHKKELRIRIKNLLETRQKIQAYFLSIASSPKPVIEIELEEAPPIRPEESQFVKQLKELINAHLEDTELSVEKICKLMNMSQSQLHRKTTALTGISPNKLIRIIRLNKAKILLVDPSNNISGVAYETGFSDPSYFGRVFKKEFGMTPAQWQKDQLK